MLDTMYHLTFLKKTIKNQINSTLRKIFFSTETTKCRIILKNDQKTYSLRPKTIVLSIFSPMLQNSNTLFTAKFPQLLAKF